MCFVELNNVMASIVFNTILSSPYDEEFFSINKLCGDEKVRMCEFFIIGWFVHTCTVRAVIYKSFSKGGLNLRLHQVCLMKQMKVFRSAGDFLVFLPRHYGFPVLVYSVVQLLFFLS